MTEVKREEKEEIVKGTPQGPGIRYGILGCAGISNKIARAIKLEKNSMVVAVASRNLSKAERFINRNGLPNATPCTYDDMIQSKNVDVIYIPIPTALRLPWVVKAIEKNKHVICEKPLGSPKSAEVIIPSCRAKNVQFMDGIQFMHHKRFKDLTEKIHKKKIIGSILRVVSSFSVPCLDDENIRNIPDLEPLGVLGDLGVHNIRLALWAFDYEQPLYVKAICHKRNQEGALQDVSVWLFFSADRVASFDCSYHCPLRQHAEIVGENGSVEIRQFVTPSETKSSYTIHYSTLNTHDTTELIREETFEKCVQEVEMVARMSRIARERKVEQFWPQVTLMTEKILDACRRSIDKTGDMVEFMKGQIWFEMSSKERRLSVIGSDKSFQALGDLTEQYQQLVRSYQEEQNNDRN